MCLAKVFSNEVYVLNVLLKFCAKFVFLAGLLTGIFSGITFVVTSAVRKNKEVDQGFSKKEIRYMIECGGGRVIDDVAVSVLISIR